MDTSIFFCREKQNIINYDPVDTVLKHLGKKHKNKEQTNEVGKMHYLHIIIQL